MGQLDVAFSSIVQIASAIQRGETSSAAVTEHLLSRISQLNPRLQAYCTVTADLARAQAAQADRERVQGHNRGALHGVPIAVKDLCFTRGIPTSSGMAIFREWVPEYDATVVVRLREAGAVLLGKLSMTEGAGLVHHPEMPTPRNPWNERLWTGASSSGSGVATAAGLCFGALGSDTGGSIRMPSAANNVTGLKTTWGRVSRYGIFPLAEARDTIGPMARSVEDVAIIFDAIAGHDPHDVTTLPEKPAQTFQELAGTEGARNVRFGIDWDYCSRGVDPDVVTAMRDAVGILKSAGGTVVDINFPDVDPLLTNFRDSMLREAAVAHRGIYAEHKDRYGPWFGRVLERIMIAPSEAAADLRAREQAKLSFLRLLERVDVVVLPAMPVVLPATDEIEAYFRDIGRFTALINVAGVPSLTLPCGFSRQQSPIGFQLVGRALSEPLLLRIGYAFQNHTDWHLKRPSI